MTRTMTTRRTRRRQPPGSRSLPEMQQQKPPQISPGLPCASSLLPVLPTLTESSSTELHELPPTVAVPTASTLVSSKRSTNPSHPPNSHGSRKTRVTNTTIFYLMIVGVLGSLSMGTITTTRIQTVLLVPVQQPTRLLSGAIFSRRQRRPAGHLPGHHPQTGRPLQLVHIPKTGGTVLEKVAGARGVRWTMCHFVPASQVSQMSMGIVTCPPDHLHLHQEGHDESDDDNDDDDNHDDKMDRLLRLNDEIDNHNDYLYPSTPIADWSNVSPIHGISWWHLPPVYFFRDEDLGLPTNPYQGADLFSVVRNPYDRLLSEYYYQQSYLVPEEQRVQTQNMQYMNEWITHNLKAFAHHHCDKMAKRLDLNPPSWGTIEASQSYVRKDGHFIPQYDFVFDTTPSSTKRTVASSWLSLFSVEDSVWSQSKNKEHPKPVVHRVLRFETLRREFAQLMREYNLAHLAVLPHQHVRKSLDKKLSIHNMTLDNLQLIEEIYQKDFEAFGYDTVSQNMSTAILKRNAQLMKCRHRATDEAIEGMQQS